VVNVLQLAIRENLVLMKSDAVNVLIMAISKTSVSIQKGQCGFLKRYVLQLMQILTWTWMSTLA
jgi:hypothetical protein